MKVLLLGEFSGLHRFLKEGLNELGVETQLVADGDGWKKISGGDDCLNRDQNIVQIYKKAIRYSGYDVVQLINTSIFPTIINSSLIGRLSRLNNCMSLVAAGGDYRLVCSYKQGCFEYYLFDYDKSFLKKYDVKSIKGIAHIYNDIKVEKTVDVIIPNMYEYMVGYKATKRTPVIPLPINVKNIEYRENIVKKKLCLFHGINRPLEKGTPFIFEALKRLEDNYPNDVKVITCERLPYDEYVEVMRETNVLIDQCCGYGYGINACIALAQGKAVLSCNSEENKQAMGVTDCPILPIVPNPDQIYQQLLWLLEHRNQIPLLGYKSRKYVEDIHDNIMIAQRYIEAWKQTGKI